eukprot:SAG11_NODE_307_length_10982_cov_22.068823_8_plen_93_part_00
MAELVRNHDPRVPMVVGMIKPEEEALGFIQLRIKRHRWHRKILKTNDPLVFSVGWRRFQSLPVCASVRSLVLALACVPVCVGALHFEVIDTV